jgi:hypothetical protein
LKIRQKSRGEFTLTFIAFYGIMKILLIDLNEALVMKKFLIAGLVTVALVACGKKEESPQAPSSSPQNEQMKGNDMAPMEETQPQSESPTPGEEAPQATEPQPDQPAGRLGESQSSGR